MLFAVIVAIGLGVMAAFVAKGVTGPAATEGTVTSTHQQAPDALDRNQAIANQFGISGETYVSDADADRAAGAGPR
jgi:ABC-type glycerol-3-phosphate transport system substrate-binding protein